MIARAPWSAVLLGAAAVGTAVAQTGSPDVRGLAARADSLFRAGERSAASQLFRTVVAADPDNSHAVYRLAELSGRPAEALALYQRYVALEPEDPWGYLAAGGLLVRLGRYSEALRWYREAARLAPVERDVVVGQARLFAAWGRTDEAISRYRSWLAGHPEDAEAWRELGGQEFKAGRPKAAVRALERSLALEPNARAAARLAQARRAAAPTIQPALGGSRDSDGNVMSRAGLRADLAAGEALRLGLTVEGAALADGLDVARAQAAALTARWRPRANVSVESMAGVQHASTSAGALGGGETPVADLKVRVQAPGSRLQWDLRGQHDALVLSPVLIANWVRRSEAGVALALPAGPLLLKGTGRLGELRSGSSANRRSLWAGGLSVPLGGTLEVSGQFQQLSYAHSTTLGYFAPRLAQVLEAASYAEWEPGPRWAVALDLGAGIQRAARQGEPLGSWRSAFRLWALVSQALSPGRTLQLEVEAYDAPLATAAAATSEVWRWGSASLSLRWAL